MSYRFSLKRKIVLVQPDMNYAPVKLVRKENEITIYAFVHFTADRSQELIDRTIRGFKGWETVEVPASIYRQSEFDMGNSGKVKVKVNVHVYDEIEKRYTDYNGDSGKQRHFDIELKTKNDLGSTLWRKVLAGIYMRENSGFIHRLSPWSIGNNEHTMYLDGEIDNLSDVAMHEFGHKLGIGDAYSNAGFIPSTIYFNGKEYNTDRTIMAGAGGTSTVTDYDVSLMWAAFSANKWMNPFKPLNL